MVCKMLKESEWARELKEVTVNLFPLLYVAKEKKKKGWDEEEKKRGQRTGLETSSSRLTFLLELCPPLYPK